jgi:glycerol kinase
MQLQADLLQTRVVRPQTVETTALGAAMLAGLAVGFWKNQEELRDSWQQERVFTPAAPGIWRDRLLQKWHQEVGKA